MPLREISGCCIDRLNPPFGADLSKKSDRGLIGGTMSASRLANLALILAVTGWLLAFYGVMSQLGDPAPTVPRSVIESHRHVSLTVLMVGVMFLLSSLWLSGRSFVGAKKRSLLAATLIAAPAIAVVASLY
jgi:hypothetical protein